MPAMSGHEQSNLLQSFTKTPNRVGRPRKYGTVEEAKKHKAELQKEKRHRQQQEPRDPSPKSSRVFQFIQYHPPPTQLHTESLNNHDQYKQISSISQTHSAAISYPQQQYLEDIDQYIPRQRSSSRVLEYIVGTSNSKQTPYHKETVHIQADIATKEVATVLNTLTYKYGSLDLHINPVAPLQNEQEDSSQINVKSSTFGSRRRSTSTGSDKQVPT